MKNYKILFFSFITILSVSLESCKKVLDQKTENTFDVFDRFNSLDDYQFALNATYGLFRQANYFGNGSTGAFSTLPDMMSDNTVETSSSLGNYVDLANWVYASNTDNIQNTWLAAYAIISQANLTLNGNGKGSTLESFATNNQAQVDRIKGQALAIRAMVHFDLLRYFALNYDRNSNAFGIPYLKKVELTNPKNLPTRGTVKETYDNIETDLLAALTLLSAYNSTNRYNIDVAAVNAILARMYLYAGDNNKAIQYASVAITARPIASISTFPNIWKDETKEDVIWACSFNAGEGDPAANLYFANGNRSSYRMHTSLINLYVPNDIRLNTYTALVRSQSDFSGAFRRVITKHWGKGIFKDNIVDWKAYRTSEQYLIRAEAYAKRNGAGDLLLALNNINTLKSNRISSYIPLVGLTQAQVISEIANERRRELFAEGHRWFDIKRTTRTIDRNPDCTAASAAPGVACDIGPTSRSWAWPIPQAEIDVNVSMAGQQNPGY
jgi:starch-binding outer membrane protein, SusD/RagB family